MQNWRTDTRALYGLFPKYKLDYRKPGKYRAVQHLTTATPYDSVKKNQGYKSSFLAPSPFTTTWGEGIQQLTVAYDTWGVLNSDRSNAILVHCPMSLSCHARSTEMCPDPGWWEDLVGPGKPLDTTRFFVICCSNLGGCFGTTGPSSINPYTERPYGLQFPFITVQDIVRSQFLVLDFLKIDKLYAAIGGSLGGMQSLATAALYPDRVSKIVSLSAAAEACPSSIALRYAQRRAVISDPYFAEGDYYQKSQAPTNGIEIARQVAMWTYRGANEWQQRFKLNNVAETRPQTVSFPDIIQENEKEPHTFIPKPTFEPQFEVERYLDYHGRKWRTRFDANSMLYLSKAMDIFSVGDDIQHRGTRGGVKKGLARIQMPVLIIGVQSDVLFPVWQQRQMAKMLREAGNQRVVYYELDSVYGHDTFLIDWTSIGAAIKGHLE